jgi:hypothetical protein
MDGEGWKSWVETRKDRYIVNGRPSTAALQQLGYEHRGFMLKHYGRMVVSLGPEPFYSSEYCAECLREELAKLENLSGDE